MMFIDAFLNAAKSSLASCAVSLQTASTSPSSPSLDIDTTALCLVPTNSTTSSSSSLATVPRKKARHALLKQLPLSNSLKFNSLPTLGKGRGKNKMLERVKDGLRSDKARSRRRNSLPCPVTPQTSPSKALIELPSLQSLASSSSQPSTSACPPSQGQEAAAPMAFPCNDGDVTMDTEEVNFAPSTRARCGSIVISAPKPVRASKRNRPLPTPPAKPPTASSSSSTLKATSPNAIQNESSGWIDVPVAPPHFHSFVRHQADVYHTLIELSATTPASSSDAGGYISYLRPIVSEDATLSEALNVAEKQLMARLYFWLILRGAKAWIVPLDFKAPPPPKDASSVSETPSSPPGLFARMQQEDQDAMCVDMASPPPSPTSSAQPVHPRQASPQLSKPKPKPTLIGDGTFPSFSHLTAYLLHIRNQPRKRERGVAPTPTPAASSGVGRWKPTTSSPLRQSVHTPGTDSLPSTSPSHSIHNDDDTSAPPNVPLSPINELDETQDWLSSLDGMDAASDDMDEDDREWARLRFQMAMDIERKSWSGIDPDFERDEMDVPERPASPAPDSPPRSSSRASCPSVPPHPRCFGSELDKRPHSPDMELDSDLDAATNHSSGPTTKRRRLSEAECLVDDSAEFDSLSCTKDTERAQMLRPAKKLGSPLGLRKPRIRSGSVGGSVAAL
ncbi:hypothetical protein BKA70DRAFT_740032 [Coprinopsis sp. MPI-PUGE-AT-0042]|nr:hypothetical protein BKA70DRAFT_740032 [Coprinopsis sp. MPI-PUGE-AT-0042]